ncbi:solute carrier family 2, facilitated glucose transporter member 12-like isoform X2 [Mya arenaria]|uniref:solute carrier family 2, facilitated glucose transporter member 12-like isoform X2 n=1 Tax=Mya arenaria TaxID=6604 RepID=UPI0022E1D570|nr:solute carrier family 2, facilitated glucose transporter member 12-like isoform X2 [Mya arenaria]
MMEEVYKEGETLISHRRDSDEGGTEFQLELSEGRNRQFSSSSRHTEGKGDSCANCYVLSASVMASLGGVLFGYDIGIISGAVLQLRDVFCLSCLDQELVTSAMLMGAVVGSLVGGFLIDHCGRRATIIANSGVFLVGAVILGLAPNFPILVIGRLLVGFAVSISATGECIYISEIAPHRWRGLLVSLNELGITLGLLLAYLCNFMFITTNNGWRWMFSLSALPAVVQGVGMFFLPRSPRYLMLKKKEEEAEKVLGKLRGGAPVKNELSAIRVSIASEKNQTCMDLCSGQDGMRGRMFIGIGLVFFQQFTGQPNVLYYAPTIFEDIGFKSAAAATLATVGLGIVKVIMTVISLVCVDRFGRRRLLYTGALMMGVSITTLGVVCQFQQGGQPNKACLDHSDCHSNVLHNHSFLVSSIPPTNSKDQIVSSAVFNISALTTASTLHRAKKSGDRLPSKVGNSHISAYSVADNTETGADNEDSSDTGSDKKSEGSLTQRVLGFTALMCYVAAYAFSFGPVTWLVLSEIYPAAVKGRAIAMATVFNWGTNLIVTFTFLDVMNGVGVTGTFVIFGVICCMSAVFIYMFVPETKNRTLEQVSSDMNANPPMKRMRHNLGRLMCCVSRQHSVRMLGNYSRVESETVA